MKVDASKLFAALRHAASNFESAIDDALSETAAKGAQLAQDTGRAVFHSYSAKGLISKIQPLRNSAFQHSIIADAPYASWVEHGRGWIFPVRAKALRFIVDGKAVFAAYARPSQPKPFMQPTADKLQGGLIDEIVAKHINQLFLTR